MFQIIPVLQVEKACHWCEPQKCYTASLWWGDCLLLFYTKDAARLEPDFLNELACDILQEITKAIKPGADTVIDSQELWKAIGQCGCLPCYWDDWRPPVMLGYSSSVRIPLSKLPLREGMGNGISTKLA
jgi:hypothetical protein